MSRYFEPCEPRQLLSTVPISLNTTTLQFHPTHATGIFKGDPDWRVTINGNDARVVIGKAKQDVGYHYFPVDRHNVRPDIGLQVPVGGDVTAEIDGELTFTGIKRGVWQGTYVFTPSNPREYGAGTETGSFTATVPTGTTNVTGSVFDDLNGNDRANILEAGVRGATVWADLNENGLYDRREPRAFTWSDGRYTLPVPSGWQRTIRIAPPRGWQVIDTSRTAKVLDVLSGVAPSAAFGIGNNSVIAGVVAFDTDYDGRFTSADQAATYVSFQVWADLDNDRRIDANEPSSWTNNRGDYRLHTDLPAGTAIRIDIEASRVVAPAKRAYVLPSGMVRLPTANFLIL